jgi:hypothetical protein
MRRPRVRIWMVMVGVAVGGAVFAGERAVFEGLTSDNSPDDFEGFGAAGVLMLLNCAVIAIMAVVVGIVWQDRVIKSEDRARRGPPGYYKLKDEPPGISRAEPWLPIAPEPTRGYDATPEDAALDANGRSQHCDDPVWARPFVPPSQSRGHDMD